MTCSQTTAEVRGDVSKSSTAFRNLREVKYVMKIGEELRSMSAQSLTWD